MTLKLPINEFVAAGMRFVMTIPNWLRLFAFVVEASETTVPSTVSTIGLARRGSISWTEKVPSALRIASMLDAWPFEMQLVNAVVPEGHKVLVGSES